MRDSHSHWYNYKWLVTLVRESHSCWYNYRGQVSATRATQHPEDIADVVAFVVPGKGVVAHLNCLYQESRASLPPFELVKLHLLAPLHATNIREDFDDQGVGASQRSQPSLDVSCFRRRAL